MVNKATRYTEKQESIEKLVNLFPMIIKSVAEAQEDDGFWIVLYQDEAEWNSVYVLKGEAKEEKLQVVPISLQMYWTQSRTYF